MYIEGLSVADTKTVFVFMLIAVIIYSVVLFYLWFVGKSLGFLN